MSITRQYTTNATQRIGTQPGMHPDDQPDYEGYDTGYEGVDTGYDGADERVPNSTRRMSPSQVPARSTRQVAIKITHHPIPPRASAPPAARRTDSARPEPGTRPEPRQRTRPMSPAHPHWLTIIGIVLTLMLIGWIVLSLLLSWWQRTQDDWHYGYPRTTQIDAVVGGDSTESPTHFIATNLRGRISVIEMHAGDPRQTIVLLVPIQADPLAPVTLQIKDVNHNGKPDLFVKVGIAVQVYGNDGHGNFGPLNRDKLHLQQAHDDEKGGLA